MTPEEIKLMNDSIALATAKATESVPGLIASALATHDAARQAAEGKRAADDQAAAAAKAAAEKATKDKEGEGAKEAVKRLEAVIQARDQQIAERDARAAVNTAVAKLPFFDSDVAANELAPKVVLKNGVYVVPSTVLVAGVPVPKDLLLDEAAAELAKAKPKWIKVQVAGGTGAGGVDAHNQGGGGEPFDFSSDPTYDVLMDPANGKMLNEFQTKHPDRFQRIQRDGLVRLQKGK